MFQLWNTFNNGSQILIAGDLNIDVINVTECRAAVYLNLLSGLGLEILISKYTRKERLGNTITSACINHVLVRSTELEMVSGVIKQKNVGSSIYILPSCVRGLLKRRTKKSYYKTVWDNKKVNALIDDYDLITLVSFDQITAYQRMTEISESMYKITGEKLNWNKGKGRMYE